MPTAAEFFAADGPLSRIHERYEYRPGQTEMAIAVERVLADGGTFLVEAGTGTGKTLAYLVPAILSGRRVVISTGTRNLQDQIFEQEIPFLRERAGLSFAACLMKGRDNYLCRHRLAELEREPLLEDIREAPWIERIGEWGRRTTGGDRAEVDEMPDDLRLWRDVNARADTCGGSRCPEYEQCWLTRVKRAAQQSQIVVVNHHLFFADLALRSAYGAVLPDYDSVIFDEAHLLEEVVTHYFGVQIGSGQIEELARQIERRPTAAPSHGGDGVAALRQAAAEFFDPIRRLAGEAPGRIRFEPPQRGGLEMDQEWLGLRSALDHVVRALGQHADQDESASALALRADTVREGLAIVLDRTDPSFVYGVERRGRHAVAISAAPIDVGEVLQERLFDTLRSAVLTSATLAVDGSFEFVGGRLGLADAESTVVPSPFDHPRQARLYLPPSMPEPGSPRFVEQAVREITRLLESSRGRAFLLFTSYSVMQRVHDALAADDRWPLLLQGQGSKPALVETFKRTQGAVLCATTSFWHGVDVPGSALSLVVVDKLPFGVPSDPLIAARIERIQTRGGNPFMSYQVPIAVLEFKQGLGRLLRSRADRGVVAVLDPRITTRRYGRIFLASLPPYPVVRDADAVEQFFSEHEPPLDGGTR